MIVPRWSDEIGAVAVSSGLFHSPPMRHRLLPLALLSAMLAGCGDHKSQVDASTDSGTAGQDLNASGDMAGCPATKPTPFTTCTNTPGTVTGPTCVYPTGACTCADASWTCEWPDASVSFLPGEMGY
jgi:hypothetical protein